MLLRPYQKKALHYTCTVQHPALFMEMRLGKTVICIRRVKMYSNIHSILIVAPYSAFESWRNELLREKQGQLWELTGTRDERMVKLENLHKWNIINKEGHLSLPELNLINWDVVILDESTFIKNPQSKVSKFFTKNFRNVQHRWILTGTPAPESPLNYYQQLKFLIPESLNFDDYWKFRHFCFNEYGYKYVINKSGKTQLSDWLNRCHFLSRKQAGFKNTKVYETRTVQLTPKVHKIYNTLKKEFVLEYKSSIQKTKLSVTKYIWMRRLFGGFIANKHKIVFPEKYKVIKELLSGELKGQSIIIWCIFIEELKFLHTKIKDSAIIYGGISHSQRRKVGKDFQSGKVKVLIAQPECFKYGMDLSKASTVIYYSTPTGLETRQQSEDRVVNVKDKDSVLIIDLIVDNTIEKSILKSIKLKESNEQLMRRLVNESDAQIK